MSSSVTKRNLLVLPDDTFGGDFPRDGEVQVAVSYTYVKKLQDDRESARNMAELYYRDHPTGPHTPPVV